RPGRRSRRRAAPGTASPDSTPVRRSRAARRRARRPPRGERRRPRTGGSRRRSGSPSGRPGRDAGRPARARPAREWPRPAARGPSRIVRPPRAGRRRSARGSAPGHASPAAARVANRRILTGGAMKDRFGREIDYLRISVIDHCNLRCVYSMPLRGLTFIPSPELLTAEEIELVGRAAVSVGFHKFRLTGGEPTLRPDIVEIVRRVAAIPGVRDVAMTTNAILLPRLAQPLVDAGLKRINVHVDTLDP